MSNRETGSRRNAVAVSDWSIVEEKGLDPSGGTASGGRGRGSFRTMKIGGKNAREVTLRIPRALFPELKRLVNPAFWNAETIDAPTATLSTYGFFSQIVQGSGAQNRTGDVVRVERIIIRGYITFSQSQAQVTPCFALVMDKEPAVVNSIAAAPAWTDMFQGIGAAGAPAYLVAVPNYDKRWRFEFLKRIQMPTAACVAPVLAGFIPAYITQPRYFEIDVPLKRLIKYDSTMGTPYAGGELSLVGWSDVVANTPQVTASYEVYFSDA
jgi:hypothetical protein